MSQTTENNSKTYSLLTGVLIFVIGIVLIICNKSITGKGFIVLAGILFLLTGVINIVLYLTHRKSDGHRVFTGMSLAMSWLVSIAAIILGLCMLVFEDVFSSMIPFIFGLLIFFGAVMLIINMLFGVRKVVKTPGWMWLFPFVIAVLGAVTITRQPNVSDPLIMILTGVSMIVFGLGAIVLGALVSGARRKIEAIATSPDPSNKLPEQTSNE
ncbi:MAG: DUF308 domain-containing protein [Muribaculaceae bacterium]|nr:DUF308 domain-containing protein [Muribaculaceae bacterium]